MTSKQPAKRRLFLLRHAHSSWPRPGEKDFDRSLDDTGRHEARSVAEMAASADYQPTRILCSPARRCTETVSIFLNAMEHAPEVILDGALYDRDATYYLEKIEEIEDGQSVLVAGHNPMIEETFKALSDGDQSAEEWLAGGYHTAGFAVFEALKGAKWRLQGLLSP